MTTKPLDRLTMEHLQGKGCGTDHCYSCHVCEPVEREVFRICLECGHAWITPENLYMAYLVRSWEQNQWNLIIQDFHPAFSGTATFNRGEEIDFCPLCLHDFPEE